MVEKQLRSSSPKPIMFPVQFIKSLSNKIWRTLFLFYFYWEWVLFLFIISLEELRHWERQITLGLMYPISSNCPMQIYVIEMSTAVWDHFILLHCTQGKLFKINWHEYLMKEKRIFLFVLFFSPFLPQPASPCFLFLLFFFFLHHLDPIHPHGLFLPFHFRVAAMVAWLQTRDHCTRSEMAWRTGSTVALSTEDTYKCLVFHLGTHLPDWQTGRGPHIPWLIRDRVRYAVHSTRPLEWPFLATLLC